MPATANSGERSLLFALAGRVSTSDPARRASSVDPGGRSPLCAPARGMRASGPLGRPCAVPRRCLLCGFEGGWIRDASTLSPLSIPSSSAVFWLTSTSFPLRSPRERGVPDAILRRSKPCMESTSIPSTSTCGSLRSVFGDVTGTLSLASGATPATLSTSERWPRILPTSDSSKYLSRVSRAGAPPAPGPNATLPDSGCSALTTTSTRPMFSSAWVRRELVRVFPVVNAAEKRRVASMSPSKIKAVCVGRRGMFLTAILKEVRSRAARKTRIRAPAAKTPERTSVSCLVGTPRSSVIALLLNAGFVTLDLAVAHADEATGAPSHGDVVRHQHARLPLLLIQVNDEIHNFRTRLRVERAGRFVRPDNGRFVDQCASHRDPLLLATAHFVRAFVHLVPESDHPQDGERPPACLPRSHPGNKKRQLHVLDRREDGDEIVGLEYEAHPLRPETGAPPVGHAGDGLSAHEDLAAVKLVEAREAVEQRRFAAAGWAHHRDHLTTWYSQVHAPQGMDRRSTSRVGLL